MRTRAPWFYTIVTPATPETTGQAHAAGKPSAPIAHVILVHGIGEISPGGVMESAMAGIAAAIPDVQLPATAPQEPENRLPADGRSVHIRDAALAWRGHLFTLTEFHWADKTEKMRWHQNPLDAARKFIETIGEVPSLGLQPDSPAFSKRSARILNWVFRATTFCLLLGTLLLVALVFELTTFEALDLELTLKPPRWLEQLFSAHTAVFGMGVAGVLIVGIFSVAAAGAQFARRALLPGAVERSRVALASCIATAVLAFMMPFGFLLFMIGAFSSGLIPTIAGWLGRLWAEGTAILAGTPKYGLAIFVESAVILAVVVGFSFLLFKAFVWMYRQFALIANLLRDVIHYFAADSRGEPKPLQIRIQSALWELIEQRRRETPTTRIVLVAHSLGTVIVTDLLIRQQRSETHQQDLVIDLVTAGSPLRRLIHRLMPHRTAAPLEIRRRLQAEGAIRVERWFNCFRERDFVGKALSDPPEELSRRKRKEGWGDARASILELPLPRRKGLPSGHEDYWRDPRFLDVISREVIKPLLVN